MNSHIMINRNKSVRKSCFLWKMGDATCKPKTRKQMAGKIAFPSVAAFWTSFLSSACPRYTANLEQTKDKTDLQRAATKEKNNAYGNNWPTCPSNKYSVMTCKNKVEFATIKLSYFN